jgi:tetratricopeptide repeat protein 8
MNNFAQAMSRFRRRRFDECIQLCDELLASNPRDQAAWSLKCQCLTKKNFIDDLEIEQENLGDILLDDNQVSGVARVGTSFNRPITGRQGTANPVNDCSDV